MGLYLSSVHAHLSGHDNLGLIKKTDRLLAWVDDWKAYLQQTENNTILHINADAPYFFNLESFLPFFLPQIF
jgi:hypothetical protein